MVCGCGNPEQVVHLEKLDGSEDFFKFWRAHADTDQVTDRRRLAGSRRWWRPRIGAAQLPLVVAMALIMTRSLRATAMRATATVLFVKRTAMEFCP
jgi:hypothetical protein